MTLRELHGAATPGPWHSDHWHGSEPRQHLVATPDEHPIICDDVATEADAALIAALRNAAPFLLDVVEFAGYAVARSDKADDYGYGIDVDDLRNALAALDAHLAER